VLEAIVITGLRLNERYAPDGCLRTVTNTSNFDLGGLDEPALRHWQSAARFARSSDVKLVLLIFDASLQRLADKPSAPSICWPKKRDGPLIDRSSIPCLDSSKIGFAGLVSYARAPAMALEEVCRRGQRVGGRAREARLSVGGV
jgi:hypothetical protein